MSRDDLLPQQICYDCAATLVSWNELYENCLASQQKFIDIQNRLNTKDEVFTELNGTKFVYSQIFLLIYLCVFIIGLCTRKRWESIGNRINQQ